MIFFVFPDIIFVLSITHYETKQLTLEHNFQTSTSATVTHVWMAPPVKMVYSSTRAAVWMDTQEHTVKQVCTGIIKVFS